uniref:hypothetical protein n=1 Tax=Ramaria rubella TaxID=113071 RepID=UPI002238AEEE|nr:hypothetical protein OQ044_mgp40 [Ramaria rubella]UYR22239.1 hypothetical protein [Ramaria rubella]
MVCSYILRVDSIFMTYHILDKYILVIMGLLYVLYILKFTSERLLFIPTVYTQLKRSYDLIHLSKSYLIYYYIILFTYLGLTFLISYNVLFKASDFFNFDFYLLVSIFLLYFLGLIIFKF